MDASRAAVLNKLRLKYGVPHVISLLRILLYSLVLIFSSNIMDLLFRKKKKETGYFCDTLLPTKTMNHVRRIISFLNYILNTVYMIRIVCYHLIG